MMCSEVSDGNLALFTVDVARVCNDLQYNYFLKQANLKWRHEWS